MNCFYGQNKAFGPRPLPAPKFSGKRVGWEGAAPDRDYIPVGYGGNYGFGPGEIQPAMSQEESQFQRDTMRKEARKRRRQRGGPPATFTPDQVPGVLGLEPSPYRWLLIPAALVVGYLILKR